MGKGKTNRLPKQPPKHHNAKRLKATNKPSIDGAFKPIKTSTESYIRHHIPQHAKSRNKAAFKLNSSTPCQTNLKPMCCNQSASQSQTPGRHTNSRVKRMHEIMINLIKHAYI